jgi:pimeloyl-ACP methyl ester carboxylesterase
MVRDEYVVLRGLRFHYRDWGDQTARPVVLLHGLGGHARYWDSFARALSRRLRLLALDQRGHGETGWADDYSTRAMVGDIEAFARALDLRSFVLMGLSMGGAAAYHYAATHPPELAHLVVVDVGPDVEAAGLQRIESRVQAAEPSYLFDSPEAALVLNRVTNPRADERELANNVRHNLMRTEDGRWTFRIDRRLLSLERMRSRPSSDENWAAWRRVGVPTLVVRGELSDILSRETAEKMLRETQDGRLVEIPGAGHSVPQEAPRQFVELVGPLISTSR